ncbi:hypothetical protein [Chelativorans salis]|uniref:Succinoglycan biosynthesis protein exoi n=1 Tax=Chelativorans salis TaxID=2978478 RepID=A0ABT2LSJ0_9HYPH|nr:hypothetical protein [Chelativorans sp. EGI FJ00035]MCT7377311.1 hypothetical protein [Chelativorans sp. EGI FJ00035]
MRNDIPPRARKGAPQWSWHLPALAFFSAGAATFVVSAGFFDRSVVNTLKPGCDIKGNINRTGERIYHVPGQEYYSATWINVAGGERWFCSEAEARAAGWRRARI